MLSSRREPVFQFVPQQTGGAVRPKATDQMETQLELLRPKDKPRKEVEPSSTAAHSPQAHLHICTPAAAHITVDLPHTKLFVCCWGAPQLTSGRPGMHRGGGWGWSPIPPLTYPTSAPPNKQPQTTRAANVLPKCAYAPRSWGEQAKNSCIL